MNASRANRQANGRIDLLPPERTVPMRQQGQALRTKRDVVDADFVTIRISGARTSNDNHRPLRGRQDAVSVKHLLLRTAGTLARLSEAGLQLLSGRAFAGLVTATFIFVFAYVGGLTALKAALPAAGPGAPLQITDVTTTLDDQNGMKILSVYGRLDNVSAGLQAVPALEIRVEGSGTTLQRRVAIDAETIAAGGSEHFAIRIPHGGGKVPKVSVSFVGKGAPAG